MNLYQRSEEIVPFLVAFDKLRIYEATLNGVSVEADSTAREIYSRLDQLAGYNLPGLLKDFPKVKVIRFANVNEWVLFSAKTGELLIDDGASLPAVTSVLNPYKRWHNLSVELEVEISDSTRKKEEFENAIQELWEMRVRLKSLNYPLKQINIVDVTSEVEHPLNLSKGVLNISSHSLSTAREAVLKALKHYKHLNEDMKVSIAIKPTYDSYPSLSSVLAALDQAWTAGSIPAGKVKSVHISPVFVISGTYDYELCFHCPFCHGYEFKDQALGIVGNGELGFNMLAILFGLTRDLIVFTEGPSTFTSEQKSAIANWNITIHEEKIVAFEETAGVLQGVRLIDGRLIPRTGVLFRPEQEPKSTLAEQLGCGRNEAGFYQVDPEGRSTVPGIFIAGDSMDMRQTVLTSTYNGMVAAVGANNEIAKENLLEKTF